ncbi:MerR family transcriptional regulator [Niabella sp. CJ426]|uniref:MerR family transcriptional regulator n=1 Tax=Niabella sp. CJ426 TaxID=3393740 RepID=UPI003D079EAC
MNIKQKLLEETVNLFTNTKMDGVNEMTKKHMDSLVAYLLNPIVNPKSLGLTYATIKYWENKGYLLLSLPKDADEWRKYSVIECLWFELLKKLVSMGCNLENVVPKLLFAYSNFQGLNKGVQFKGEQQPVLLLNGIRVNTLNNFLNHILLTVMARSKATLYIGENGCQFLFSEQADRGKIFNIVYDQIFTTGIGVSISDIVFSYVLNIKGQEQAGLKLLNENELTVLNMLNNKQINQITVKQDDGKIYEIQSVEKMTTQEAHQYLSSFITSPYQELIFRTNNNKEISITRTTKQQP